MPFARVLKTLYITITTFISLIALLCLPRWMVYVQMDQFALIMPGMTREQVVTIMGKPWAVYPPSEIGRIYPHPKPRIEARGEIWVYQPASWIRRMVVHFDEQGRVQCTVVVRT